MKKYTVVISEYMSVVIIADNFNYNGEYNRVTFCRKDRNIACFVTTNIIGFYEIDEKYPTETIPTERRE